MLAKCFVDEQCYINTEYRYRRSTVFVPPQVRFLFSAKIKGKGKWAKYKTNKEKAISRGYITYEPIYNLVYLGGSVVV